jgi:hypothetical protein
LPPPQRRTYDSAMRLRRLTRALALTVMGWLVVTLPQAAYASSRVVAQKVVPPSYNDLHAAEPWTYWMAKALFLVGVLIVLATVVGYVVKSREFAQNQRRGGSK